MSPHRRLSPFRLAAVLLVALAATAAAQFDVSLKMSRKTYLLHEAVKATVAVTNLSANDIVVGGPNGTEWITFTLTGHGGRTLSPYYAGDWGIRTTVIKAGQTINKTVVLNSRYPLSKRGNYSVRASVYYPPLQRYLGTRSTRFNVDDGRVFWERPIPNTSSGGGFRNYQLLSYNDADTTEIYLRIREEQNEAVIATYSLGKAILYRQPQATVDRDRNLHVIFMGAPNAYAHTIIDPGGRVVDRKTYTDKGGNPPRLMQASDGSVGVRGGTYKDPLAEPEADVASPFRIHDLSERPPGWTGGGADPLNFGL